MNSMKLFAIAAAVMMLAVAGIAVANISSDTEASSQSVGTFDIFVYDGYGWDSDLGVAGYDACKAMDNSDFVLTYTTSSYATNTTYNDEQVIGIYSALYNYTYNYPNVEYGDFYEVDGDGTYGSHDWTVYIYDETLNTPAWVPAGVTLGWIKPFDDYKMVLDANGQTCAASNIALVKDASSFPVTSFTTYLGTLSNYTYNTLTEIDTTTGSAYEYYFTIQDTTSPASASINTDCFVTLADGSSVLLSTLSLTTGFTIIGYGSDANLALYQALGKNHNFDFSPIAPNVYNSNTYTYDYYSWLDKLFNVGDDNSTGVWKYWMTQYYGTSQYSNTVGWQYCDFNLGYYSDFSDGYNYATNQYKLTYC